tara:strand:- start:85824 stop:86345 length:522 start_codon:yes stop_codon:yes gene_type:complete
MLDIIKKYSEAEEPRDVVFKQVVAHYQRSTRIFQVGAIETLDKYIYKIGSGWSDFTFGKHIKKHGGHLTVCDISVDHLANSSLVASSIGYDYTINHGDAINFIESGFDIYYLDGSNDPKETEDQLEKIMTFSQRNMHILVDDFRIKGVTINTDKYPFIIHDIEKGLGVLHYGK